MWAWRPSTVLWVFMKPGLENFQHYFASLWDECNCVVVWTFLALPFFGIGTKADLFQSCGHCWVFQIFWHIGCSTLTPSSFRIWNSSTGIPSPSWLIEFCQQNALVIANTLFQQHKRRLYTWTSPDGQYWNQTDYILCKYNHLFSKDGEALYSQQKQDQELTVAQIMNSLLPNSD